MRKILIGLFVVFFCSFAWADINLTIATTAAQDAKIDKVLARVNQQRIVDGYSEFADVESMIKYNTIQHFRDLIREQDREEFDAIFEAWRGADTTTKDQIRALLGVP